MVGGIVRDTAFCGKKHTRKFRSKLFSRIALVSKTAAFNESVPIQTRRVAAPVGQLVKGSSVVIGSRVEGSFGRKVNAVAVSVVESSIILIVTDPCTRICEDALTGLKDLEFLMLFLSVLRNPVKNSIRNSRSFRPVRASSQIRVHGSV